MVPPPIFDLSAQCRLQQSHIFADQILSYAQAA
jgi:hypothetical protein